MKNDFLNLNAQTIAQRIIKDIEKLPVKNAPSMRPVLMAWSKQLNEHPGEFIIELAREMLKITNQKWLPFELILEHPNALSLIDEKICAEFAADLVGWGDVDAFAGYISGHAWRRGQISDAFIHSWARSENRWLRRAALVSTVPLNRKAAGGTGDVPRTLAVCKILADDKDDMVVKALSWALREVIKHDRNAVEKFLSEYENVLAGRVKREVRNKLETGVKNPKR